MTTTGVATTRPFRLSPMRYFSVPAIDLRYWAIISLASVFGCNMGDFISLYLHLGHWLGLAPLALIFAALVAAERRWPGAGEGWYWAVVIVLRTAATNLADLASHTFQIPYAWVIVAFETVLVLLILPIGPRLPGLGANLASRPATDGWYWAALLTAGALGTAIGDCVAEDFDLGTGLGTVVLSAITAATLVIGARGDWTTKVSYWLGIVAVRAAGTTAGDFVAFKPGLGLGCCSARS